MTSITHPRGNTVTYEYDAFSPSALHKGNLLLVREQPGNIRTIRDSGHHQDEIVTKYVYNATYPVVTHIIEARGTDADHVPQNGGTTSEARYTTRICYDFEEATLGDKNGDGVTSGTDRVIVQVNHTRINRSGLAHASFTSSYAGQWREELFRHNSAGQTTWHRDTEGTVRTFAYYPTNGNALDATDREGMLKNTTLDPPGLALVQNSHMGGHRPADHTRTISP